MRLDTLATPSRGLLSRLRWTLTDTLTVTGYNLRHIAYVPEKLIDVTIQPVILVFLFAYIFGTAITLPGEGDYREYLMPGIFTYSVLVATISTAAAVVDLMGKGLIDRFRSLPMAQSAVLAGQTVSDLTERVLGLAITVGCGLLIGWRAHEGIGYTLTAFGLLLLLNFAMIWVGVFIGLMIRSVETASAIGLTLLLPLSFISNTFVPTEGMPAWLRTLAEWNPVSATVAACRQLFGNTGLVPSPSAAWPLQHPIAASLGWSLLILTVFAALAVRRYQAVTGR
jgi:ABC-2 type transport system permease protein